MRGHHCISDPCVIDARDFGLKADGVTDDLPALNAALAAFPFDGLHYQFGGKLLLPSGNILLSDTWLIDRIVDVCGVTGHSNGRTNIIAPRTGNPAIWFVSKVDSPRWQDHQTWEVLGGGSVQDLVVQGHGDFTKMGQHGIKTTRLSPSTTSGPRTSAATASTSRATSRPRRATATAPILNACSSPAAAGTASASPAATATVSSAQRFIARGTVGRASTTRASLATLG
ncbi:MAG: hypothetical protein ACREC0_05180 [Methylocella sp.]